MAGVTEHSRISLTAAAEHSHNHGRKPPLLVYAFEYKPEHLGSFYYLYEALGPDIASKLVFAVWEAFESAPEQCSIFDVAVKHPAEALGWVNSAHVAGGPAEPNPMTKAWCEDLVSAAYMAAQLRDVGWMRPSASTWGSDLAKAALCNQHMIAKCITKGSIPMHVARPPAFEHVKSGDSLMLWHPDALNTATLMAHPADPTYSSLIFREGPCNDVTLRDIWPPFTINEAGNGKVVLTIRAKDFWITSLLAAWTKQCLQNQTTALRQSTLPKTAGFIGNILHILIGNTAGASSAISPRQNANGAAEHFLSRSVGATEPAKDVATPPPSTVRQRGSPRCGHVEAMERQVQEEALLSDAKKCDRCGMVNVFGDVKLSTQNASMRRTSASSATAAVITRRRPATFTLAKEASCAMSASSKP